MTQEEKAWSMSKKLRQMVDSDPVSFEWLLPCILAYWINKTGITIDELSQEIKEALADQAQQRVLGRG